MKHDIKSLDLDELKVQLSEIGEKPFRAKQIFVWLHNRAVTNFSEMTDLSTGLREKLENIFYISKPKLLRKQVSAQDGTIKYLWELGDGNAVETVLMRYKHGNTVCISTQVGCKMGCAFCASAIGGLVRNLSPAEMIDEVLFTQVDSGEKISNIVLMGIGEPLDNYDNTIKFLRLVNSENGLNIGMRHISLSTCGLTDKFAELEDENLQLTLSVSLHAPDDQTRNKIMPVNRKKGVDELFSSCRKYFTKTGRRISFEYAMIDGVNDTDFHAETLAQKVKGISCHVNLIPLNHVDEREFRPSKPENLKNFVKILEKKGVNVTVRRKLGGDIDASCGQLRRKSQKEKNNAT